MSRLVDIPPGIRPTATRDDVTRGRDLAGESDRVKPYGKIGHPVSFMPSAE